MTDANYDTDPFTRAMNGLWSLLTEHDDFARLVKVGNRHRQAKAPGVPPNRSAAMTADRPAVTILPAGSDDFTLTSTGVQFAQSYAVALQCGSEDAAEIAFPLKWAAIRALYGQRTIPNLPFVTMLDITEASELWTDAETDEAAGLPGWTVAILIRVMMYFTRAEMAHPAGD